MQTEYKQQELFNTTETRHELYRVLPAGVRPKLLDMYCCGGGAGYGYEQAGYDVTGVDMEPQPKHRGKFIQADAIEY